MISTSLSSKSVEPRARMNEHILLLRAPGKPSTWFPGERLVHHMLYIQTTFKHTSKHIQTHSQSFSMRFLSKFSIFENCAQLWLFTELLLLSLLVCICFPLPRLNTSHNNPEIHKQFHALMMIAFTVKRHTKCLDSTKCL